jgi:hypothetical protein
MIGDLNPFPFQVGGGPSRAEIAYETLRKMVGTNGYSAEEGSLEAEWRKSKTMGLVALGSFDERATNQAFPHVATDHLVLFEKMLGIVPDETKTDEERRDVVVPDYTGVPEVWYSQLVAQLQRVDERADVLLPTWKTRGVTMPGRAFGAFNPVPGFQYDAVASVQNPAWSPGDTEHPESLARTFTHFPAASDVHRAIVHFDIGSGVEPSRDINAKVAIMKTMLNELLPAWVDFRIIYAVGFILDESLLDVTGFGS